MIISWNIRMVIKGGDSNINKFNHMLFYKTCMATHEKIIKKLWVGGYQFLGLPVRVRFHIELAGIRPVCKNSLKVECDT